MSDPSELPDIWTDEQCDYLNKQQQDAMRHPYTCGNDSNHRVLVATRKGWQCLDCDYRQYWAHGIDA